MDDIQQAITAFLAGIAILAPHIIAGAGLLFAAWGIWSRWGSFPRRLCRSLRMAIRLSDAIHERLGSDPAKAFEAHWLAARRDAAIQEIRKKFIESHLGIAVYVSGSGGEWEYVNDSLSCLFGIDKSECNGHGWIAAVHPEDRERVHGRWSRSTQYGIPYADEYRLGEGHAIIVTEAYPIVSDHSVLAYVGIASLKKPKEG